MKKTKIKAFAFVLSIIMLVAALPAYAATNTTEYDKLLYIVDSYELSNLEIELDDPSIIVDLNKPSDFYGDVDTSESIVADFTLFDYISSDEVTTDIIMQYKGVAIPYNQDYTVDYARSAYNSGKLVYLYGELTISEYKNVLGILDFSIDTIATNSNGTDITAVKQGFDSEFEKNEKYNVISYSNNAVLCKFSNEIKNVHYLISASENCASTIVQSNARATIVKSEFDFVTYWGPNNIFSVHLDYTLYREYDESDPTYDYFGIKTTTWVDAANSGTVAEIRTKYSLPYESDNLLETGPASQKNIGSLSVSCGYGDSGVSASIGYSIDLSDQDPTINRTENFTNDTVEWIMTRRTWFPKSLDGVHEICVATWASTGKTAGINVYYGALIKAGQHGAMNVDSGYTSLPIRFSYSD